MAENQNDGLFRITKKGGYEKEDVDRQFQTMKAAAAIEKENFAEQLAEKDREIAELRKTIYNQREEIYNLNQNINKRYKKYIENYDTIGQVILDSRVQAKKIIEDAYVEKDRILSNASDEVEKAVEEARAETIAAAMADRAVIEEEIQKKKAEYDSVCEAIANLVTHMSVAQERFDEAVRLLHDIEDTFDDADEEEEESFEEIEESFDDSDDLDKADTQEYDFRGFSAEI